MKLLWFAAGLLAWAAPAFASCESILIVQARDLQFWYTDTTSDSGPVPREHYDGLAHGLATGFHAWQQVESDACEAATPRRIKLSLQAGARFETPGDLSRFAGADSDSTCRVWTCVLGTFRDSTRAARLLARLPGAEVPDSLTESFDGVGAVHWYYTSCVATVEVRGFLASAGPFTRVCSGLFFSRGDAEREAGRLEHTIRLRPVVTRIPVDGALLESMLHAY